MVRHGSLDCLKGVIPKNAQIGCVQVLLLHSVVVIEKFFQIDPFARNTNTLNLLPLSVQGVSSGIL